jgi:uncharacterized protein (DUF1684 family)
MDDRGRAADRLQLADWRRRVAALYAEVRDVGAHDPHEAWERWRRERESLYRGHPQSPVPVAERDAFHAHHWPYDDRVRWTVAVGEATQAPQGFGGSLGAPLGGVAIALPNSGADTLAFDRVGRVALPHPEGAASLDLFWMRGYSGGLFLPFLDATSGHETYGAGRYLLDTAKGADLGGDPAAGTLVVDLNFAFHPSCAFDPKWACPLAPPGNRLATRVEAGERLR